MRWLTFALVLAAVAAGAASAAEPADQQAFCAAIDKARAAYRAARADSNPLRSRPAERAVIAQYRADLKDVFAAWEFVGWSATLSRLLPLKDGRVQVKVELPCKGAMATNDATAVRPASPFYAVLPTLDIGQAVVVSGRLLPHPSRPAEFWETSFTEVGSILEPEFAVELTDLRPVTKP